MPCIAKASALLPKTNYDNNGFYVSYEIRILLQIPIAINVCPMPFKILGINTRKSIDTHE